MISQLRQMRAEEDRLPFAASIHVEIAKVHHLQPVLGARDPVEVRIFAEHETDVAPRPLRQIVDRRPIEFGKRDAQVVGYHRAFAERGPSAPTTNRRAARRASATARETTTRTGAR